MTYAIHRTPQTWTDTLEPLTYGYQIVGQWNMLLVDAPIFPDSQEGEADAKKMANHLNLAYAAGVKVTQRALQEALGLEPTK